MAHGEHPIVPLTPPRYLTFIFPDHFLFRVRKKGIICIGFFYYSTSDDIWPLEGCCDIG